jgi:hypothetical protein
MLGDSGCSAKLATLAAQNLPGEELRQRMVQALASRYRRAERSARRKRE